MLINPVPYVAGRRRTLRAAAALCLAGATLGLLTPASPAHAADRVTAMDRCTSFGNADASQTVVHGGNRVGSSFPAGTDPGNAIFPGDVVRVTVSGTIRTDHWGYSVGPNGTGVVAGPTWPFADQFQFSSVARWNHRGSGWVDAPMQTTSLSVCTRAPQRDSVRLMYFINDPDLGDNGGLFYIHTDVYWG